MKLASLKHGRQEFGLAPAMRAHGRDGCLVVVSRDLAQAVAVPEVAATLQAALDDWSQAAPRLAAVAAELDAGHRDDAFDFREDGCAAPLPRAYQWADGSAYVNHVELVRRARGAEMPQRFWEEPLIYQGGSDDFLGPRDDIVAATEQHGIDFEGEVAVITDDVPMGTAANAALGHVKLIVLVNDVSLRNLIPGELEKGFGFFQSKPATSFAPVAITPDELGAAWRDGRVHLPLLSFYNDEPFGRPNAGQDMTFGFAELIAHACATRNLGAGTIIGSGTVSNKQGTAHGGAIAEGGVGYSCIAELRTLETLRDGQPRTPFMRFGDRVRLEMRTAAGASIFGAIDQRVTRL